ncbi:hypothetical protein RJ639_037218 [Escallonia herrerae]|uniref:Cytochrome P450 n=1 Tax=Escallonia herrerae TaxID=1293975 RepID=A0AA89BG01_9ASTE|nr:hypothetical protein RJ639_037218 [Escallonia herrerae]
MVSLVLFSKSFEYVSCTFEHDQIVKQDFLAFLFIYCCASQFELKEENMNLSKNKDELLITSEDVAKLTYTKKVVEETIRVANVAFLLFQTATKDVEYKGYTIPKGWKVVLRLRYLHTNPKNFKDPMCFNPDGWNESLKPKAFQVFGGGSRICARNMLSRWDLVNPNARIMYLPSHKPEDGVELTFSKL